ncbi:uncharacterized [Tachysurus ichikawai]
MIVRSDTQNGRLRINRTRVVSEIGFADQCWSDSLTPGSMDKSSAVLWDPELRPNWVIFPLHWACGTAANVTG